MTDTLKCLRCLEVMDKGFIVDIASNRSYQALWHKGTSNDIENHGHVKDFSDFNKEDLAFIDSYRCPKCGLLESYAHFEQE